MAISAKINLRIYTDKRNTRRCLHFERRFFAYDSYGFHFEFRPQVGRGAECHHYAIPKFFNSLDFSVQFFIPIKKKLNTDSYIAMLAEAEKNQDNELMKIQTKEYIEFIKISSK